MSEQTTTPEVDQTLELNNEMTERRSKLAALRAQGNPFPNDFRRDSLSGDLHAEFGDKSAEELVALGEDCRSYHDPPDHGQGFLRDPAGHGWQDPDLRDP